MEEDTENVFPCFKDGDVAILLSPTKRFNLHSQVLKQNSTFFEAELSEPGAKLTAKARRDGASPYRFELISPAENSTGYLQQREISESGKVLGGSFLNIGYFGLSAVDKSRLKHWGFLLGFFYGKQPEFDETQLGDLLRDCHGFMDVAEEVGSVERVREVVDLALLRQDTKLWPGIAKTPTAWADLAIKIRSPTIYQEAVVHLVGKWRQVDREQRNSMDPELRQTVERIYDELEMAKEAIEMRILGHYPPELIRDAADKPGRPSYSNDIYMWMSVCFFRQFWAQAISDNRTRLGPDGGCEFYRSVWQGEQAYLSRDDFQSFHQYFPMSSKACNVLEVHMDRLKETMKQFIADLMVNRSHLPEGAVEWLTCAKIEKSDLPWFDGGADSPRTGVLDVPAEDPDNDHMSDNDVNLQPSETKSQGKTRETTTTTAAAAVSTGTTEPFLTGASGIPDSAVALDANAYVDVDDAGMLADDEDDQSLTRN